MSISTLVVILGFLVYLGHVFVIFMLVWRTHDLNVRLSKVEGLTATSERGLD